MYFTKELLFVVFLVLRNKIKKTSLELVDEKGIKIILTEQIASYLQRFPFILLSFFRFLFFWF